MKSFRRASGGQHQGLLVRKGKLLGRQSVIERRGQTCVGLRDQSLDNTNGCSARPTKLQTSATALATRPPRLSHISHVWPGRRQRLKVRDTLHQSRIGRRRYLWGSSMDSSIGQMPRHGYDEKLVVHDRFLVLLNPGALRPLRMHVPHQAELPALLRGLLLAIREGPTEVQQHLRWCEL